MHAQERHRSCLWCSRQNDPLTVRAWIHRWLSSYRATEDTRIRSSDDSLDTPAVVMLLYLLSFTWLLSFYTLLCTPLIFYWNMSTAFSWEQMGPCLSQYIMSKSSQSAKANKWKEYEVIQEPEAFQSSLQEWRHSLSLVLSGKSINNLHTIDSWEQVRSV